MSNENIDKYVIYDWAVEIKGKEEIQKFLDDPKGFLKRIGALDRSPDFNGFVSRDGEELDPGQIRERYERDGGEGIIRAMHYGIPYDYPYYCTILV